MEKRLEYVMEKEKRMKQEAEYAIWLAGVFLGIGCISLLLLAYCTPFSFEMLSSPCWIHKISGLYCPGCGGTRAFLAILQGNLAASFFYHPLVPYMGALYAVFMIRGVITLISGGRYPFMKFHIGYIYVGIGITIFQFLIKNILLLVFHTAWL